ncbi:hypothetical protein TRFO_12143 [Tritrichomonas foetus]|uniref:R13L1/DRL21-like LRR repeat region domain-containing protein n=1 Tax=Tritrichomonas foetus TaxID=1144522 RepID=A0A1J4J493_9EUKA|nr:hypothetical protein TRFO_12143 [Tritrichomonas foetus]|eukprot:OHS92959.1 hypothetical protein TRFO_12143 [Tritrichomonas foetus]
MSDLFTTFKTNRNNFLSKKHTFNRVSKDDFSNSILETGFAYSLAYSKFEHPKASLEVADMSPTILKSHYKNAESFFSFADLPFKNPPLNTLKHKKSKKDLVFFYLSGVTFTNYDCLKNLSKFNHIRYLCLANCSLNVIPNELFSLPKYIKSLDLTRNNISVIPNDVHWKQLEGINLSENALTSWPSIFEPEKLPSIISIDISFNRISEIKNNLSPFTNLESLILDYTPLKSFPSWISACMNLKYLSLKGCDVIYNFSFHQIMSLDNLSYLNISNVSIAKKDGNIVLKNLKSVIARNMTLLSQNRISTHSGTLYLM